MRVPIFPLDLVAFPGSMIPLNIFEDRYKVMVQKLLRDRERFGICLIKEGRVERGPLGTPHGVGTLARIIQIEEQATGNYHLLARGEDRFRITALDRKSEPYLVADVELFPDEPAPPPALAMVAARVAALFDEYYRILVAISGGWQREAAPGERTWTWDLPQLADRHKTLMESRAAATGEEEQVRTLRLPSLPEDPSTLSFTVASELALANEVKQDLLEAPSVLARLQREAEVLTRELPALEQRLQMQNRQRFSGFGALN
ncbi:MAG TPA: LON peptidase substrate-binding domain-containing protein [Dehalococcoidia bacterium]|nr:LON peptidase substrate-binding domain-containing protein [Dehalococcoidia bacterium]